jgi:hypothetical protein
MKESKVLTGLPEKDMNKTATANIALAIWPAGRAAIGRTKCYWAAVPANENLLGSIFYLKLSTLIEHW